MGRRKSKRSKKAWRNAAVQDIEQEIQRLLSVILYSPLSFCSFVSFSSHSLAIRAYDFFSFSSPVNERRREVLESLRLCPIHSCSLLIKKVLFTVSTSLLSYSHVWYMRRVFSIDIYLQILLLSLLFGFPTSKLFFSFLPYSGTSNSRSNRKLRQQLGGEGSISATKSNKNENRREGKRKRSEGSEERKIEAERSEDRNESGVAENCTVILSAVVC